MNEINDLFYVYVEMFNKKYGAHKMNVVLPDGTKAAVIGFVGHRWTSKGKLEQTKGANEQSTHITTDGSEPDTVHSN